MNTFAASRPRLILSTFATVAVALLTFTLAPASAQGECITSTPRPGGPLSLDDSADNIGGAADIAGLSVSLDSTCVLSVYPNLRPFLPLLQNQYLIVQFALDPPPANPIDEVVNVEVYVFGNDVILDDGLGGLQLPPAGASGFTVTLDELGITTSPMDLGIGVVSVFDPTLLDPFSGDEVDGDYHPNLGQLFPRIPVTFTRPTPAVPAPAATPLPPPAITKKTACVVPRLKGLTVKKAKAALRKAGCSYKVKGKGRVRSSSPKAGTATDATVRVKCKKRKRRRR